jgi:outer membrane receptor protein involved in Fe transport
MSSHFSVRQAVKFALLVSAAPALVSTAHAQDSTAGASGLDEIVVTGTRIQTPGAVSSSPITTIGALELETTASPDIQRTLLLLPGVVANDNQNVNNGTVGAATISLRNLGSNRNLLMIDGKRITPYDINGIVDTTVIPKALVERIDVVTGGASAVYGSDAISGAVNFVMKKDFEGVAVDYDYSQTGKGDGDTESVALTIGGNFADGRGNMVATLAYGKREGIQLGSRPLGQLGIVTANGGNYQNFLNGVAPTPPPANCGGTNAVAVGGSTTTIPTRVAVFGGPALGQVRTDGTLGANCSEFNFNPYNYYQTPQERWNTMAIGSFSLNDHAEVYGRAMYSTSEVDQQIAPSGVFGNAFWTPLANPFITASQRASIIAATTTAGGAPLPNVRKAGPGVTGTINWRDLNNNNIVDVADDLQIQYRRRTNEFGPRATSYAYDQFQVLGGVRGNIIGDWDYDAFYQYGESKATWIDSGYTNVANIENAVNAVSTTACRTGGSSCVPINFWGPEGSITEAMVGYSAASAIERRIYSQAVMGATATGPINFLKLPTAANPLAVSIGVEYREEEGETIPDECLKLAPTSCLGGAGGNVLPIAGGFNVREAYAEAIFPILEDLPFARRFDLELGYRYSDYSSTGNDSTYKYGFNWRPFETVMLRAMKQRAARAPNVGELAAPLVTSLQNASRDPCSIANASNLQPSDPNDATLRQRCIATGMLASEVGTVEDIVSGQVNSFSGTDLTRLPSNEKADTLTAGIVWTPSFGFVDNAVLSIDYYDIDIDDYIGTYSPDQILTQCYTGGLTEECAKIRRIAGTLTAPGAGIETFTTNLLNYRAEGVELGFGFAFGLGGAGSLQFQGNVNKYLSQEYQAGSAVAVVECVGIYGTDTNCNNPLPEIRWTFRTTWQYDAFQVSALWRHLGGVDAAIPANYFRDFQSIDAYNYLDLYASWDILKMVSVNAGVTNVFDKDPPVVGNEAGTTSANSGNTFPGVYDTVGRVYSLGVSMRF